MKKILMSILSGVLAVGIGVAAVGCSSGTEIVVINREDGSGTRDAFIELLGIDETELYLGAAQQPSTSAAMQSVAGDVNAIGYISLGSVDGTVKAISVNGVAPSKETVLDGTYAIARPFELMYQTSNDSDLLADFLTYLKSAEAQAIIADEGYVSTVSDAQDYTAPEEALTDTELNLSGSTSVGPLMLKLVADYQELVGQDVTLKVNGGGSGQGITDAENGTSDIGMASKEVTADDFNDGSKMTIEQLCKDGIAVIVNPANSITNMTTDTIKAIYTAATTAWEDVDGWVAPAADEK